MNIGNNKVYKILNSNIVINRTYNGNTRIYGSKHEPPFSGLRITALEDNTTIKFYRNWSSTYIKIDATRICFSTDEGKTWEIHNVTNTDAFTFSFNLSVNLSLLVKGTALRWGSWETDSGGYMGRFYGNKKHKVSGILTSITNENNFDKDTPCPGTAAFRDMFEYDTYLYDASELILPKTNIKALSFGFFMKGCTNLQKAPKIVFENINYDATCYSMFLNCSKINEIISYVKNVTQSTSATGPTGNWLDGVSSTGTFYNLGGADFLIGASGIPSGWTIKTSLDS